MAFRDGLRWESGRTEKPPALAVGSCHNDELANELGNLLNRVVSMIKRYRGGVVPAAGPTDELEEELQQAAGETRLRAEDALERWDIGGALGTIWGFVRRTNQYIERSEPWKLAR